MEYCKSCKMPIIDWGMDRCYCDPEVVTLDNGPNEDENEAAKREAYLTRLVYFQRNWLAPIAKPADLKGLTVDPTQLPVSVFCTDDSNVYENDGNGWTYMDEYGFRQDVVLAKDSYAGCELHVNGKVLGKIERVSFRLPPKRPSPFPNLPKDLISIPDGNI